NFFTLLGEFQLLIREYLVTGSIDRVRAPMRQICRTTAQTGVSLEIFIQTIFESDTFQRKAMLDTMPCDAMELHHIFFRLDDFKRALFDEFIRARSEYWQRREQVASKVHTEFFSNIPLPAFTGSADLIIREANRAAMESIPLNGELYVGLHLD